MRAKYWVTDDSEGYKNKMDEFIQEGKMELLETRNVKRGVKDGSEMFQEMDSKVLIFKKTK